MRRLFEIIEVGASHDLISRTYDYVGVFAILVNLAVSVMMTFDDLNAAYGSMFVAIEAVTVVFFAVDYVLRIMTAGYLYPQFREGGAVRRYVTSFTGIIDLLSFLPYFLPFFFPEGAVAFRMIRIIRIFRLFRINAYYDALNVITRVLISRRQQLISSVFIIMILMLGSSLCMYSLEHDAQPEIFKNAFSGLWWSVSTLLTVGYGDIYPITILGKVFGIIITFLGVGMVAIPTGIISAGFVEQFTILKRHGEYEEEIDIHFVKVRIEKGDPWAGREIRELQLPHGLLIAVIKRGTDYIVPRGDVILLMGDTVVIGAEPTDDKQHIELKELKLGPQHDWVGQHLKDIDISRQSLIVIVKRGDKALIPKGSFKFREGDTLIISTHGRIKGAEEIEI